ncbi:MAG: helix-turn-helix transcriptional regulator [Firmicutes bacterium]|nr:helix-turn-helix transcriptional regulator [Bacillota bacterium]
MDFQKTVAKNIKEIRERKKITLDAAAKLTGVSRSMLAQIEKGDVNPTISVLWKIANGYKTSFTSLVDTHDSNHLLIKADEVTPLVEDEGRYINRLAFMFREDTQFETCMIEIKPDGFLQAQPHMGGTEEYLTVFAGEVEVIAGSESFHISAGDSLRFKADVAHSYRNVGSDTVNMHMIIHYTDK